MLKRPQIDRAWIAGHIPQQGTMCLLDGVEAWDEQHIECRASSHRDPENPLRAFGRLGAACGVEYAAQAMAVHGQLLSRDRSASGGLGYLVSLRNTQLHVPRLDDIFADLKVEATCILRNENTVLYEYSVAAAGALLLNGRATIVIDGQSIRDETGERP